jgi:hypothetical protein
MIEKAIKRIKNGIINARKLNLNDAVVELQVALEALEKQNEVLELLQEVTDTLDDVTDLLDGANCCVVNLVTVIPTLSKAKAYLNKRI